MFFDIKGDTVVVYGPGYKLEAKYGETNLRRCIHLLNYELQRTHDERVRRQINEEIGKLAQEVAMIGASKSIL